MKKGLIKMTGCNNKRRFSLKYSDGRVDRYGSCDPKDDDGRKILNMDGNWYLAQGQSSFPAFGLILLPPETLWTNGYYDKEHDGWKPISEWV